MALKKCCARCSELIDYAETYCSKHKDSNKQRNNEYNTHVRYVRDKKYADFYNSREWHMFAKIIRAKYSGLCLMCLLLEDTVKAYDVIHHVLEIKTDDGWEHRLDVDGCVSLCHACHNSLHSNYTEDKIEMLYKLIKEYLERFRSVKDE